MGYENCLQIFFIFGGRKGFIMVYITSENSNEEYSKYTFDITHFPSLRVCDTMSDDEVLNITAMKKSVKYAMEQHAKNKLEVYNSEKSGWITTVLDPTSPTGKRKIHRCSEESLWLALADWYAKDNISKATLADIYEKWLQDKQTPTNQATIKRTQAAWNAYYKNEPLSQDIIGTPMAKITSLMLRDWVKLLLKKHYPVDKKKFYRMFSIISQCYEYATDEDRKILQEDVWQRAKRKILKESKDFMVKETTPSDEEQVFTDEERRLLKEAVYEDLEHYKKQASSAGLQILFMLETGLRIGECCGLKWSDVKDKRLYIRRQADNNGIKDWTKSSAGKRDIPLTDRAQEILKDIKAFNDSHNYKADWIFQSDNPDYDYRLSYNAADRKLRKLCKRIGTANKSPHKLRKTYISILYDAPEVNNRTVQRVAGHADIQTTSQYYLFDRTSKEEQAIAINEALKL